MSHDAVISQLEAGAVELHYDEETQSCNILPVCISGSWLGYAKACNEINRILLNILSPELLASENLSARTFLVLCARPLRGVHLPVGVT